jgi:hypothetical protein
MATPPDFTAGQILTAAQMNQIGLWKVTPTSVSGTGATIDSDGNVVVLGGGTNFTVNGAFSADFSSYKIIVQNFRLNAAGGLFMALGTSNTGTSHNTSELTVNSAGAITGAGTASASRFALPLVSRAGNTDVACEVTLVSPFQATETFISGTGTDTNTAGLFRLYGGINLARTSFSALHFSTATTETISVAVVKIYGYN